MLHLGIGWPHEGLIVLYSLVYSRRPEGSLKLLVENYRPIKSRMPLAISSSARIIGANWNCRFVTVSAPDRIAQIAKHIVPKLRLLMRLFSLIVKFLPRTLRELKHWHEPGRQQQRELYQDGNHQSNH